MHYVTALIQLPLVRECRGERIRSPEDVARVCSDIKNLAQESFHVLVLNAKNSLIGRHLVSIGLVDASLVHPREVFSPVFAEGSGATAIVLVHQHPSGDPTPSAEDIRITKQLVEAGKILSIPVQDHVIIGRESDSSRGFVSMREHGLCEFAGK